MATDETDEKTSHRCIPWIALRLNDDKQRTLFATRLQFTNCRDEEAPVAQDQGTQGRTRYSGVLYTRRASQGGWALSKHHMEHS